MDLNLQDVEGDWLGERSEDGESCGSVGGEGFDTRRSLSQDDSSLSDNNCFNDEGLDLPADGADPANHFGSENDKFLQQIKDSIAQKHRAGSKSNGSAASGSMIESPQIKTSDQFQSVPYGLIPRASYEHGKRSTDIMGVTYNARMRQFMIVDSKGVTAWKRDAVDHRVMRALHYPKYEYGLITNMLYAKKYNCYFVLGKDFSLKVYNRDFFETCSVSADLRSVLFMLFNPVRDELITGGVGGTKVWTFHQQSEKKYTELKPLANYGLTLKYELPNVGGSWVKRVELDYDLEHLYCCSDTDLHVYDLGGKLLFKFERAHMMSITGCRYSRNASVLVTSSIDCEVKVWSLMGGLVHTFRGHSRAVTNLILHPYTSSIVITCSLDGTVRMWSLDTMDTLYSLVVSTDGVMWMGLTDDNLLFLSTQRAISVWNLNYSLHFWAMARSRVTRMTLVGCKGKTTRLMALTEDSSVRLMARSNKKNLCTVLPPPSISPLQRVLSVCYSREFNVIFMLTNPHEIWVYTTRTDPSCRIAVWDVIGMQAMTSGGSGRGGNQESFDPSSISVNKPAPTHRATENGGGNESLANCCCVAILNSTAIVWTEEGCCCPIRDSYLLMGLEDGRILFMDPVVKGHKYLEFKTGKDPVLDMSHDLAHGYLTTVHKLKDMMQILVWSLPDLELHHEVFAAADIRAYARVCYTLVTGHESGCVIFHPLEITNDPGLNKGRMPPLYEEVIDVHHKPEHLAPVIGVDVCVEQKIFCSCSDDGAIKIWNEDGVLMTEIMLDPSLTSVCFLNNMGDLLVGFQKQIFYIDHSKVCPQLAVPDSDVDGFDKESFICEDPAVLYEGVTPNPDPITLENYLVPYDIEFSKDFLEGKVKLEPDPVKEEESDEESEVSMAPTDIYLSPVSTPRSELSHIDLTLGSEVSKYDLLKQMKKTLAHLHEKERLEAADFVHQQALDDTHRKAQARRRRRMMKQGILIDEEFEDGVISRVEEANVDDNATDEKAVPVFEFPKFGESPGPTPESSSPPTPQPMSETEDDTEPETVVEDVHLPLKVEVAVKEPDEIAKFLEAAKSTDYTKTPKVSTMEVGSSPRKKFGLSGFSIDAESLMKEKKKVMKSPSGVDTSRSTMHSSARPTETVVDKMESPRKEKLMKKRKSLTGRKLPKSRKGEVNEDKERPASPPSTQMQALELKEQKLAVPEKKIQNDKSDQTNEMMESRDKVFDVEMNRIESQDVRELNQNQTIETKDLVKVEVPGLPSVPVDLPSSERHEKEPDRAIKSASSTGFRADTKSSIDFSSVSRAGTLSREITLTPNQEDNDTVVGRSEPITTDSGIHMDRMSLLSGGSEEGQTEFRITWISKQVTHGENQANGTAAFRNNVSSTEKPSDTDTKKETKIRDCHPVSSVGKPSDNSPTSNNKQTVKGKSNYVTTKTKTTVFTKEKPKRSGGTTLEPKTLSSLLEVEDTVELPAASQEASSDQTIPTVQPQSFVDEMLKSVTTSSMNREKPGCVSSLLEGISTNKDSYYSQPEIERASPDSSSQRAPTPSLSVIDTESIASSSNLGTSGFARALSSPVPPLTEGPPFHSSPLPTVDEVSVQSLPSSIQSEASHPNTTHSMALHSSTLSPEQVRNVSKTSEIRDVNPEHALILSSSSSGVKQELCQEKDVTKPQDYDETGESKKNNEISLYSLDTNKETSNMSDKGVVEKVLTNLKDNDDNLDLDTVLDKSSELNKRIEMMEQSSTESKLNSSVLSETQDTVSLAVAERNSEPDDECLDSHSPISQVIIQRKCDVEDSNLDQIDAAGNDQQEKNLSNDRNTENDAESCESDFDNISASDGSCIMSSPFSDTTCADDSSNNNNSSLSSGKKNSRQSLQNLAAGNVSSSSATEPLLQVKIRKKPWSYYRNKEQQRSSLSSGKQGQGQRKFSQSDALTVQRKAYLDTVKLRKKRARSAVEGSPSQIQNFQKRQVQQHQMQQLEQQLTMTSSPSVTPTHCVICAAEGVIKHEHVVETSNIDLLMEKNEGERKVSFGDYDGGVELPNPVKTVVDTLPTVPEPMPTEWSNVEVPRHSNIGRWGKDTPSTFEPPDVRPQSQAFSTAFSDLSSIRPIASPDYNQSISLTDFSHSHEDPERRPESQESGWMGSDLISVSRMDDGHGRDVEMHVKTGDLAGDGAFAGMAGMADRLGGADRQVIQGDLEDGMKEQSKEESLTKQRRPKTSLVDRTLGKPELDDAVKFFRQRPHTAQQRFQTALQLITELPTSKRDLQEAFDGSLKRYKVMARTPLTNDKIHRNDDMAFSENWHERQIERHMLLRMQKELRAQSAKQRRQVMEQVKQERFRHHQEEDHGAPFSKFPPYMYTQSSGIPPRSTTVHGSRPSQTGPTTTPVSSRPHTSTGVRNAQVYAKQIIVPPQHQQSYHLNQQLPPQPDTETRLKDRSDLSQEKAFRFRLREKEEVENDKQGETDSDPVDLWMIDPRNPNAVRPKSRKSIPSKCHRYVLVTKPKIKLTLPLPTPLEEELLASRFPEQGEKVYKKYEGLLYKPPRRPVYGIEYTPFHQTFQTPTS